MHTINGNNPVAELNTIFTGTPTPDAGDLAESHYIELAAALALGALLPGDYVMFCADYVPAELEEKITDADQWAAGVITSVTPLGHPHPYGNGLELAYTAHGTGFVVFYGGSEGASAASLYVLPAACVE